MKSKSPLLSTVLVIMEITVVFDVVEDKAAVEVLLVELSVVDSSSWVVSSSVVVVISSGINKGFLKFNTTKWINF